MLCFPYFTQGSGAVFSLLYTGFWCCVFLTLHRGFWCCVFLTLHRVLVLCFPYFTQRVLVLCFPYFTQRVLVLCFPSFTQGSGAVFSLLHRGFWCCVFLTLQITLFLSLSPLSSQCCSSCMIAQGSSPACMYSMKKAENLSYGLGKMMAV